MTVKLCEGYLGCGSPPEEQGILDSQVSQTRTPVPIRGVPTTSSYENQWGFCLGEMEGYWSPRYSS